MRTRLPQGEEELHFLDRLARSTDRRTFLHWSGLTIAVVALGCNDNGDDGGVGPGTGVNLGSGDTGILNYAYALEQLEAAFYTQLVASFYSGATAGEQAILTDIKNHEVIHRDFLKAALGSGAIGNLEVDFTSVNFGDRASVLGAAKTFEDLGVCPPLTPSRRSPHPAPSLPQIAKRSGGGYYRPPKGNYEYPPA